MNREAIESVNGRRFHDAGPAVVKEDCGEVGPAVYGNKRGREKGAPRVHLVEVSWIRLRLDPESGREMGRVGSQVGSGSGSRDGRGQRVRKGEGESGWFHGHVVFSRTHEGDVRSRHGLIVRLRVGEVMHAAMQRHSVVVRQVLGDNFGVSTFFVSGLNAGPFRNESRFGSGRGTGLGFTGSLGLPLQDRFPIFDLFSIKLFFPFCSRQRTLGAMVVGLVAPCAAVRLDVIEQLALSIAGDFSAVDRGGRVGAFEAGWEAGGLLVGRTGVAGCVLAGLELVLFLFAGRGWVAFVFILGVK
jgi:hypothetical protein